MRISKLKIHKKDLEVYIALVSLILILFGSGDTMIAFHNAKIMYVSMILNAVILIAYLSYKKDNHVRKMSCDIVVIMLVCIIGSILINVDMHGYSQVIVLVIALLFSETIGFDIFFKVLDNVMFILSFASLIAISVCFINPNLMLMFPESHIIGTGRISFANLGITVVPLFSSGLGIRNYGLFREPATYCIYLGLALVYQLYLVNNRSYIRIVIYLLAIISTGSATGYLATLFIIGFFLLGFKEEKFSRNERIFWLILIVIGVCVSISLGLKEYLFMKVDLNGEAAESSLSRIYSIVAGILSGIKYPLFGAGATKCGIIFDEVCLAIIGRTVVWANMVTYLFVAFGFPYIYIFLKGIYGAFVTSVKKLNAIIIFLFICLLLCGEMMTYSSLMYVLMLYGYKNIPVIEVRNRNKIYEKNSVLSS